MKVRKRNNLKRVFYSDEELEIIKQKMALLNTDNFSAFCRKMTIDGFVVKQDYTDMKQIV